MQVSYWNDGSRLFAGKYIYLYRDGRFVVGEILTFADGSKHDRCRIYRVDGTSQPYDF